MNIGQLASLIQENIQYHRNQKNAEIFVREIKLALGL